MEKYNQKRKVFDDKIQLLSNEYSRVSEKRKEIIRKTNQSHKLASEVAEGGTRET